MNKRQYMNEILGLCSETEQARFAAMYPDGVGQGKVKWATTQVENTIKKNANGASEWGAKKKETATEIATLNDRLVENAALISSLEKCLVASDNKLSIAMESTSIDQVKVAEDLRILEALRAGGVDNWDFYDVALTQAGL